jgi:hypothetical protein
MAVFIGIFISLIIINILLLVFSTSLRSSTGRKLSRGKNPAAKSEIYQLKVSDSKYQEAV